MFTQKPWMKSYIDYNTDMRKLAANDFEKDFFKLMNNSVFGKTIESTRKRIDLKLSGTWDKARNHIKKPNFNDISIFTEDLVAIHMHKSEVMLNKPIYVGLAVLELSKVLMYDTYYSDFKRIFRDCKAVYTDTDSLILHIRDSNIYRIMNNNVDLFDNSDYPTNHVLYNTVNKKVLGKWKDELGGKVMTEFISLRSKSYAYRKYLDNSEGKRHKGVKKHIVKKLITFQDYFNCLLIGETRSYDFEEFKSINHQLYTIKSNKKGLSNFDTKRLYINAIQNRPFE
jgi:hypothetical protein